MRSRFFVALSVAGALVTGCQATPSNNTTSGAQGGSAGADVGGAAGMAGAGGMGSSSSSSSSSSGMGGGPQACVGDADCLSSPIGPVCDVSTGECVGCLPGVTMCGPGKYCDATTKQCSIGCGQDADCSGLNPICDTTTKTCVECLQDTQCPQGQICGGYTCFPGCSGQQPCMPGFSCCGASCYDLATDINNCGSCGNSCPSYPNAASACADGKCGMGACLAAYADCDQDPMNGCEWNVLQDGACACVPGMTKPCYQGSPGTENIGPCKGGVQTCNAMGTGWSACEGQVLPRYEICANSIDEDCNGTADDAGDADGDGWPMCNGDCCDSVAQGCANPKLINPGAFEVVGNGVDDDCNAATSDVTPPAACSTTAKFTGVNGVDVANAIEICQYTTENQQLATRKWGLINAYQLLANGNTPSASELASIKDKQTAVLMNYGTGGIVPKKGATMAGLSSGYMRDINDPSYPGFPDTDNLSISTPPAAYLAAYGGALPASAGCSGNCPAGTGAYDGTNIRLRIRTPTNAQSFSYQFKFISYEYWVYSCTQYNDFYLALLKSDAPGLPADKNISFDGANNPVSVNNGFFDVCVAKGCYTCPAGYGELAGTGMDSSNYGGATKWLTTEAPIKPGETMELEFIIFDVSDGALDSVTLLDNFQWGLASATVNTHE